MSGAQRAPNAGAPPPPKQKSKEKLSEEDQKELELLEQGIERIKKAVPSVPYILSTPSLHPYNHYSKQESRAWMMGHLFQPDEEHLQYRTFQFREPYQDCFTLQPGEVDPQPEERPKSRASLTPHQAPKRVISLSDYKSKQANGVITPGVGSKKVSPNLPPMRLGTQTNGTKTANETPRPSDKPVEVKSNKRPAIEPPALEKPEKRLKESNLFTEKAKADAAEKAPIDRSAPSNSTPHGLPPMLSPVDPTAAPYGLPAILSPTLPTNIQAELDKIEVQRKRGDSNASTSSSDRKSQLLSVPERRNQPRNEESKSTPTPRVRSLSLNGKSPVASSAPAAIEESTSGQQLIVKLKYKKKLAAKIAAILRLKPSRKDPIPVEKKDQERAVDKDRPLRAQAKPVETAAAATKSTDAPKITTRRVETSTPVAKPTAKVAEKRPRLDDDQTTTSASKRPKLSQERPTTPSQPAVASPALPAKSSAQKSQGQQATPRKELKSVNMLRTASTEGSEATPGRLTSTPSSASRHLDPKTAPTSAPVASKKQQELFQFYSLRSHKLNKLGRSLKHQAQSVAGATEKERGRAAVLSLECILSYIAAYQLQDHANSLRGRPSDVEGSWKTLWPLCSSYAARTKEFPHLDGLRLHLNSIISASICHHVTARAPRSKAHDSPQDVSEAVKQSGQVAENFNLIAEHYGHLLRATQDARIKLPIDELQKKYPETWSARNTAYASAKLTEKFPGGNLSGPYFLPIQTDTSPIQAVRFGLQFLKEHCAKEKITYSPSVNLERPE